MLAGLITTTAAHGCGATPTLQDVERSDRQRTLASALLDEGNVPGALAAIDRALGLNSENAEAYALRGHIYTQRGDYGEAERALGRAMELYGRNPGSAGALAEVRNMLGIVRTHQGRYTEAVALFHDSATDIHNGAPHNAWGNLGQAHIEAGEYAQAVEVLEEAVRIQARFCFGFFLLGRARLGLRDLSGAEASFTQSLEADPRCVAFQDAWRLRGETRAQLEHREDALADFQHCVELGRDTEAGRTCQRYLEN